jgi:hypothetical protein
MGLFALLVCACGLFVSLLRVLRGLVMAILLVKVGCFAMRLGCVLVMFRCFVVCFGRHGTSSWRMNPQLLNRRSGDCRRVVLWKIIRIAAAQ